MLANGAVAIQKQGDWIYLNGLGASPDGDRPFLDRRRHHLIPRPGAPAERPGATVRLCLLPYESHGYTARESIGHVLYEMLSWFDRHVKNAPPRR